MLFAVKFSFQVGVMHILNTLCLFKYIIGKLDFKCTYNVNLHAILQD